MSSLAFIPPTNDAGHDLPDLYLADEGVVLEGLIDTIDLNEMDRAQIGQEAASLIETIREATQNADLLDAFLLEYGLSNEEGVTLMRLSEALIRTPDFVTAAALMRDKIASGNWSEHAGDSKDFLVNQATSGLRLSSVWVKASGGANATNLASRLGDRVLLTAINRAMALMGEHFVLGHTIEAAVKKAQKTRKKGYTHSYDMLGEAALTMKDADRYFAAYEKAIRYIADQARDHETIADAPGISVKLSALHPRYEFVKRKVCVPHLVERVKQLCLIAKEAGLGLAIDAEEADRLEVSLMIIEPLMQDPDLAGWDGLGVVVQAYQRRASAVLRKLRALCETHNRKITVRLVKGAYWDSEIKRAQELGLDSYPVFTRKENTDVSYLACARILLDAGDWIFPQFATHNALTAATILHMAGDRRDFEFQRLHGMGEDLHAELVSKKNVRSRIYAPVGPHEDLLPYLVRRLLENGANSSFVNQLLDPSVEVASMIRDPITTVRGNAPKSNPKIPEPRHLFDGSRLSARGFDLTQAIELDAMEEILSSWSPIAASSIVNGEAREGTETLVSNPARRSETVGTVIEASKEDVDAAMTACATSGWADLEPAQRANVLRIAADALEEQMTDFMALCVREAGKTMPDAEAEVREAVDFLRYYARQAEKPRMTRRQALGTVACISPWNFPLAIFTGQVAAALSVGNTVIAKPAEQTPLVAWKAVRLLHACGVPVDALHLVIGAGEVGAAMVGHEKTAGVCFTGSTATAKRIATTLADTGRADIPLIAETGGINAMIIDSTALLEQAVKDVVASAFQSAGQRCSACRIVCVQDDIAEDFREMLSGAMAELKVGDPKRPSVDVGPVIDQDAFEMITSYTAAKSADWDVLAQAHVPEDLDGCFAPPTAFKVGSLKEIEREIFGPVLHVVEFEAEKFSDAVEAVNALGYGLTMGAHTRIDARVQALADAAHVGNLYINRNQIGAVVGVHPFGGEGLSGTGPKAGGPNYLLQLTKLGDVIPPNEAPEHKPLPGPTGEENTLRYFPRGALVCFGGDTPGDLHGQVARAVTAGDDVWIVEDAPGAENIGGAHVLGRLPKADALKKLNSEDIAGACADGEIRAEIAEAMARRDGAILPVLSAFDETVRYCHERTLTINTTAAGGNASLLALS